MSCLNLERRSEAFRRPLKVSASAETDRPLLMQRERRGVSHGPYVGVADVPRLSTWFPYVLKRPSAHSPRACQDVACRQALCSLLASQSHPR
ncbi:hypothetical protein PsYK624_063070 [Phanerochaete sordida]|uniref:Uncharacterized protein n=1 Tax=Phanerochaete sordida TaxID=48140 RepID=A0A9P3G8I3_9APHY|nr:hypothetical protein PsYK624_063070 [Phanerochaete sordida]